MLSKEVIRIINDIEYWRMEADVQKRIIEDHEEQLKRITDTLKKLKTKYEIETKEFKI